ncbi:hypothetical protein HDU76_013375 [Blyttiomyces sp. JEL0837]|nr:hypothetical protein HDU76_013375 [Blyttiomyces sp. JEL0837]
MTNNDNGSSAGWEYDLVIRQVWLLPSSQHCPSLFFDKGTWPEGEAFEVTVLKPGVDADGPSLLGEPVHARCCGLGDKDRRCIDPTPILALTVREGNTILGRRELIREYFVVHASLWSEDGTIPIPFSSKIPKRIPILSGLSVRVEGRYVLKFSLMNLKDYRYKV